MEKLHELTDVAIIVLRVLKDGDLLFQKLTQNNPHLETSHVMIEGMTDACLKNLSELQNLRSISLDGVNGTTAGVVSLLWGRSRRLLQEITDRQKAANQTPFLRVRSRSWLKKSPLIQEKVFAQFPHCSGKSSFSIYCAIFAIFAHQSV